MYSRNLVIAASLAVLTLGAPTPATAIVQHEQAVAERRDAFSLTGLVRDVLKRHALIEAVPDAASDVGIDQRSEEVDNLAEVDETLADRSLETRAKDRGGNGWKGRRETEDILERGTRNRGGNGWKGRREIEDILERGTRNRGGNGWKGRREAEDILERGTRNRGGNGWKGRREAEDILERGTRNRGGNGWKGRRQSADANEA